MTAQMVHDVLVFERKKMKRISGGRTRTRTLDPLIKSQLLYQLSYAPELLRRGSAERAWLSKGGRQCPAARFIQAPRRVKEKAAGLSGGFWMAIRVGEIALAAVRYSFDAPYCGCASPPCMPRGPRWCQPPKPWWPRKPPASWAPSRASATKRCFWLSSRLL